MTDEELRVFKALLECAETEAYMNECERGHLRSVDKMIEDGDLPEIKAARELIAAIEELAA